MSLKVNKIENQEKMDWENTDIPKSVRYYICPGCEGFYFPGNLTWATGGDDENRDAGWYCDECVEINGSRPTGPTLDEEIARREGVVDVG